MARGVTLSMGRALRTALAALVAASAFCTGTAQAQAWPNRPVRVIIPFPPGAGAENAARLGARSPINAQRDFVPVGLVSRLPFFVVVPSSVPVNSVQELIALAKSKPGAVTYASNGNGTAGHLGWEILKRQLGVEITHIPYKGYAQALPDLLGGRVTTMMADLVVVGPTIKEGRLRALAATSLERSKFLPNLPTMAELGFPGYEVTVWFGVFAPAGTPPDIVAKLNGEMRRYLATAEARESYEKLGHEAAPSTPEELRAQMASDGEKYGKLIREANLKLE